MFEIYARNCNDNVIILRGDRQSLRCRQRSKQSNGLKVRPMRFVSYKEAQKKIAQNKTIYGPFDFYTVSKL